MLVLYSMAGSMIADICDQDELENGVRREGSYSAVYQLVVEIRGIDRVARCWFPAGLNRL